MALPSSKQDNDFTPIEAGNYEARLTALFLAPATEYMTKDTFNEGEGLRFQAAELTWDFGDGITWTEKFVKVSTNEKAKFYNRLCALLGRELTAEDEIGWDLAPDIKRNLPLDDYFKPDKDDPEKGHVKGKWFVAGDTKYEGYEGNVIALKVNGENLIGKSCMLELGVNAKGYNTAKAGAATTLPKKPAPRKPATSAPAGAPT